MRMGFGDAVVSKSVKRRDIDLGEVTRSTWCGRRAKRRAFIRSKSLKYRKVEGWDGERSERVIGGGGGGTGIALGCDVDQRGLGVRLNQTSFLCPVWP